MRHIVSFETAKALKAAGYPQPEFETGQIWYNLDNPDKSGSFYAPSATEIIQTISLTEHSAELYCCSSWQATDCFQTLSEFHENPAEAAAREYLKIKQQ